MARPLAGKDVAVIRGYESNPILMDALDHCRTTRAKLAQKAADLKIGKDKLMIPQDGELIYLSR